MKVLRKLIKNHRFIAVAAVGFMTVFSAGAVLAVPYISNLSELADQAEEVDQWEIDAESAEIAAAPSTDMQTSTKKKATRPPKKAAPATTKSTLPRVSAAKPAPAKPKSSSTTDIASESKCPGQSGTANAASVLTCMTSHARTFHGKSAVSTSTKLNKSAVAKVQDLIDCGFSHTACGKAMSYWINHYGYSGNCKAENIAAGQSTIRKVFVSWMESPGHRENIMYSDFRHVGFGFKYQSGSQYVQYWGMHLGGC